FEVLCFSLKISTVLEKFDSIIIFFNKLLDLWSAERS
ncbi:unnamed protein product, partial [Urochloa humidicola]